MKRTSGCDASRGGRGRRRVCSWSISTSVAWSPTARRMRSTAKPNTLVIGGEDAGKNQGSRAVYTHRATDRSAIAIGRRLGREGRNQALARSPMPLLLFPDTSSIGRGVLGQRNRLSRLRRDLLVHCNLPDIVYAWTNNRDDGRHGSSRVLHRPWSAWGEQLPPLWHQHSRLV